MQLQKETASFYLIHHVIDLQIIALEVNFFIVVDIIIFIVIYFKLNFRLYMMYYFI
jgi:hypothetical protein